MPRPTKNATFRPELAVLAYGYALAASQKGFIGGEIFPAFEVDLQASVYPMIPAEALLQAYETKRSARGSYGRSDYEFDDGDYCCRENGWEEAIDDTEAKMYKRFFDAEVVATQRCMDVVMRNQEKRIAAKVQDTTKLPHGAAAKLWTDPTASMRDDSKKVIKLMRDTIGLEPTCLCIPWDDFQNALVAPELKDYLKYTNTYLTDTIEVQKRVLAQYLGVPMVHVGNAVQNSAKKGQKFKPANIWANGKATFCVTASNPMDLKEPCIGRTFLWTEDSPEMLVTESYREEQTRSDIIRCRQHTDECYVFEAAGYVLTGLQ